MNKIILFSGTDYLIMEGNSELTSTNRHESIYSEQGLLVKNIIGDPVAEMHVASDRFNVLAKTRKFTRNKKIKECSLEELLVETEKRLNA